MELEREVNISVNPTSGVAPAFPGPHNAGVRIFRVQKQCAGLKRGSEAAGDAGQPLEIQFGPLFLFAAFALEIADVMSRPVLFLWKDRLDAGGDLICNGHHFVVHV